MEKMAASRKAIFLLLFLMKNDLAGAEQMLARLNKACFLPCEEYRELKDEIAQYKAKKGLK